MYFGFKIWPLLMLGALWQTSCGSRQKAAKTPAPNPAERLDLGDNPANAGSDQAPGPVFASEAERRHCLAEQEKTLETWGWDRGRGVEGVIDLLLDETQQANPIPLCTPQ